ncbi:uncharacterized protein LOC144095533 [Amblyomma americanum]
MHCVLLGVVRIFLCLWFDTKHHGQPWYIGRRVDLVDSKLLAIKPPDFITRTPRSLKHRCYWKGNELRGWLLFYCFPVLSGILPDAYLEHFNLLVSGIYMLLSESVSFEEVYVAEKLLFKFVDGVHALYGARHCSFNVHQLLHLAESVRNWGPLWCTSAFLFENRNGQLLLLIKGTPSIEKQLSQLVGLSNALSALQNEVKEMSDVDFVLRKIESVHFTKLSSNAVIYHDASCRPKILLVGWEESFAADNLDRFSSSGRGGGIATMSLTNPSLFYVLAVLFNCPTPSTAEARCSLSVTVEKDYCMVKPTSPQKCDINDMFLTMRTWMSPPA